MTITTAVRATLTMVLLTSATAAGPWQRHTIDDASRGADGVRLADANGDGLLDIVTGWEEGGVVRLCINPGPKRVRQRWPAVTVGRVASPEDAVLVDLDGDGAMDVVSSCQGRTRTVFVHWAPRDRTRLLDDRAWQSEPFPATAGKQMWMFAVPAQIDGRNGIDLFVGSKGRGACIGWLQSPAQPRQLGRWRFHRLYDAGWIMSLVAADLDGDGDPDLLASDRLGAHRGVLWLEHPGPERAASNWTAHRVAGADREVMFLDLADLDGDGLLDVITSTRDGRIIFSRRTARTATAWRSFLIGNPFGLKNGKAVRIGDIDRDGRLDIVHTSNTGGDRARPGVTWLSYQAAATDPHWQPHDISGPAGVKFDLLQLLDLDADGDLDVITCEERDNLGVFWYENPQR